MTSPKTKRPSSSYLEEDIIVKPSTELIADEYEHFDESSSGILVYTFSTEDKEEDADRFLQTLEKIGLKYKGVKHSLENENCLDILIEISQKSDEKADGLILFFFGYSREDGTILMKSGSQKRNVKIEKIWTKFNSYNCIQLKNKPKIFLFEILHAPTVQMDGKRHATISYELAYDTPGEADILIVHNKTTEEDDVDFIETLCENIECFGNHEDIISIVTVTSSVSCQPLVISTLTRKFYFTVSEARGHHLTFETNNEQLKEQLNDVKSVLANRISEKKIKKGQSFLSTIRNSLRRPEHVERMAVDGNENKKINVIEEKKVNKTKIKEPIVKKKPTTAAPNISKSKASLNSIDKPRWKF